ncbi:lysophospholipid acyltransferase family protein [Parafrankia discariae]|uniref:lysophospholipid acyltransferase family protein n=1 Tax=Parafrankia discariae TaxID=365528 RepID=UPI00036E6AAE|nr:lysophospholipid acyltransferase family protein [Parafrankia discariae]
MLYWVVKAILTPILRVFWRPWVEGLDHVPTRGPAILASNHLSFLDSFFLPLVVPRRITFLAKSDYFTGVGLKGWSKRKFFSGVGQVPIDRSGGKASEGALRTGVRVLGNGDLLGIYPEGTRSPDGRLYRGKIGVARMALEAGVPVIPVAMIGTFEVQPLGRLVPRIRRVGIRIGRPLDFSRYAGMADDRFVLRSMTDEIMYELMSLSGQEYVDMYAQRRKEDLAAARETQAAAETPADPRAEVATRAETDPRADPRPETGPRAEATSGSDTGPRPLQDRRAGESSSDAVPPTGEPPVRRAV